MPDTVIKNPTDWAEALDSLERSLFDDPASDDHVPVVWSPPAGLGPIPPELIDRAERIAAAQQLAIDHTAQELRLAREHLAAVRTVPQRTSARAVYIDVEG